MEVARTSPFVIWLEALRAHARAHTLVAIGFGIGLLGVVVLLVQSLFQIATGEASAVVRYA